MGKVDWKAIEILSDIRAEYNCLDEAERERYRTLSKAIQAIRQKSKIVYCDSCIHRGQEECPMRFEECVEYEEDGFMESDWVVHDYTEDSGFCHKGERREDPEEHTRAYWCENERYEIPERREE